MMTFEEYLQNIEKICPENFSEYPETVKAKFLTNYAVVFCGLY